MTSDVVSQPGVLGRDVVAEAPVRDAGPVLALLAQVVQRGYHLGTGVVGAQTHLLSKPKPLAKDAVTHDWTAFLGPTHNAISTETRLSRRLPPPLVWEFAKGTGYASPAIAGERLVFLHRLAISTGLMDRASPTRRSRALMRQAAKSCGAKGQNGRRRSRPAAGVSSSSSGPIGDRYWPSMGSSCVSASSGTCYGSTSRRRDTKRFRARGCLRRASRGACRC